MSPEITNQPEIKGQNSPLSPAQAKFVYWLNGLAPVLTNVVTPLIVFWKMGKAPKLPIVKYNQQVNEVVRQFISGTIGLLSYFGGGELTKGAINRVFGTHNRKMDEATRQVAMIVGGVAMSFIGFAFVRPYISTDLICRFLKQEKGLEHAIPTEQVQGLLKKYCSPNKLELAKKDVAVFVREQTVEQVGAKSSNPLVRWLQNKIDHHLLPNGEPSLKKTAIVSTMALSGYLALLTGALWGVNRMLGKDTPLAPVDQRNQAVKSLAGSGPLPYQLPVASAVKTPVTMMEGANPHFARQYPQGPSFKPIYSGTISVRRV